MPRPSGRVYLCANAIIDRSYNHTIDFKNPSEQQAYWGSLVKYSISEFSYIRRSNQFIKVEYSLDELQEINYLYFRSTEDGKLYYCFVTSKEYQGDKCTYIYFETDVLQTRMFEYEVKESYVLQEHCDRWDADHNPIYSRTDEGLDYGSEYTVESAYRVNSDSKLRWYLAVCKPHQNLITEGYNSVETTEVRGVANPFVYYLLPGNDQSSISETYNLTYLENTASVQVSGILGFTNLMATSELGSYVQQIVKLPYLPFNISYDEGGNFRDIDVTPETTSFLHYTGIGDKKFIRLVRVSSYERQRVLAEMGIFEGLENALPTAKQWEEIKAKPYNTERDKRFESKLLTHPYRYNILTDWKNTPSIIKNEYIGSDKITLNFTQGITSNAPARYWLDNYKKDPEGRGSSLVQITQEDSPVVTDQYYEYMLANRNQIQADRTNAIISGVSSTVKGFVGGGVLTGNVAGIVMGGVSSGIDAAINYQGMIRSQNAKQSDLKNLPDTIINSNDGGFNIQDKNEYVTLYRMKICCEFEELLADTFNMTGYTVKRVKKPNLKTRARFNYIKTVGANIVGSFDQNELEQIKGIFDKGVTFWHYNTINFKPYDYSLENIENKLI